ncbi:hypothetical protein BpHYR1_013465 [Brachionus plicatilis]|uniref:Uncharacterized protein n=1 Tax=Brachionus plicatilis TaxID=10195 RepID=A0A3M7QB65_BRAPC|nr:hypothetical protein BpHYR1_013465 [Brachionus plicatilis]
MKWMKHITRRSKKDENAEEKSFVIASAPSATTILGQAKSYSSEKYTTSKLSRNCVNHPLVTR